MGIAFVETVKKRQMGCPIGEQRQADLAEVMLAGFVVAALAELRIGMAGHEGVVIGGIEQETLRRYRLKLPDLFEKGFAYAFNMLLGDPVPFLPVFTGAQGVNRYRAYVLDCGMAVPRGKCPLALGGYQPVCPGIEKIFSYARPFLSWGAGDYPVDNPDSIQHFFQLVGNEQGPEGLGFQPGGFLRPISLVKHPGDAFGGSEVGLGDNGRLAIDTLYLPDVIVGSSFFRFFV